MAKGGSTETSSKSVTQPLIPEWLQSSMQDALSGLTDPGSLFGQTYGAGTSALADIAGGAGGYGSPGFNAALMAAYEQGLPLVQSAFSKANRSNSGLAQAAVAKAFADPFASLFNAQQQRQLQAAGTLPNAAAIPYSLMPQFMLPFIGQKSKGKETTEQSGSLLSDIIGIASLAAAPFTGGASLAAAPAFTGIQSAATGFF